MRELELATPKPSAAYMLAHSILCIGGGIASFAIVWVLV